jgi:hypothetical protein
MLRTAPLEFLRASKLPSHRPNWRLLGILILPLLTALILAGCRK